VEIADGGSSREDTAHDFALDADASSMNNPERLQTEPVGLRQVFLHHAGNIPGGNAMQIEDVGDGDSNGFFGVHGHGKDTKGPVSSAGRAQTNAQRASDLSNLLRAVLRHDRFHLVFQTKFQFFQPDLF